MVRRRRSRVVSVLVLASLIVQLAVQPTVLGQAVTSLVLTPLPNPSTARAGMVINVFASQFPAGPIDPSGVVVSLVPTVAGAAPSMQLTPMTVTTLVGSSRRVTFQLPSGLRVAAATTFAVTLSGATRAGDPFRSGNASLLLVTPAAQIVSISPVSAAQGTARVVTIDGQFTNFVQGTTVAQLGPGIRVGGAPAGVYGPVTVVGPTRITAQIAIDPGATLGPRTPQVRTGAEIAARADAFSVTGPTIGGLDPARLTMASGGATGALIVSIRNPDLLRAMHVAITSTNQSIVATPAEVLVPAGAASAPVPLTGGVSGGPVVITATLNGTSATADVTVHDRPAPPVVTEPLTDGATTVGGTGTAGALVEVRVNGAAAGAATAESDGHFGVTVAALIAGQVITATQTFNGLTSAPSAPVVVLPRTPAPAITPPLVAGATSVAGTGIAGAAVQLFANSALIGAGVVAVNGSFAVTTTALIAGQQITAVQTVGGVVSVPSAPVTVVDVPPAPTITAPLLEGQTTIGGGGVTGGVVEAFVNGISAGTSSVGNGGSWTLALGAALIAGQHVSARQTVNGVRSSSSPDLVVQARPSAPTITAPVVEGSRAIGGGAAAGASVEVLVDGVSGGTAGAGGNGTWSLPLASALSAGQRLRARQTVGGIASALSAEVIVVARPPAPVVTAPIIDGATSVAGTGVANGALTLIVDGQTAGTATIGGNGAWSTVLGAALTVGQHVTARQRVNGIDSLPAADVIVVARPPAPVVGAPIVAGALTLSGTGTPAATVEVFANGVSLGTTAAAGNGVWSLPLTTAVIAGQVITARQTVAGIASALSAPVTVSAALQRIDITPAPTAAVLVGQTVSFSARGTFSDNSLSDPLPGVTWTSDATTVAPIAATGIATGAAPGVAHIRASRDGVQSALTTLTVKPLAPSVTAPLTAGATTVSGTGANAGASVQVSVNGVARGTPVTADGSGSWTAAGLTALALNDSVTAKQTVNGVQSDSSTAVVVIAGARVLTAITVTPALPALARGANQQFTATGLFSDNSSEDLTASVTWESTNTVVAIITPGGVAAALDAGTTTVRATKGAISGSTTLTVNPATLASIVVTPDRPTVLVGQGQTFTATGILTDGTSQNLSGQLTWSSNTTTVARIDQATGAASALAAGQATIRATKGSVSGTALLTVQATTPDSAPPAASITAPANNAVLVARTNVVGTATDPNFSKYVLDYAPIGATAFTTIAEKTTPVTNDVLGVFDPTVLLNDLYVLRLRVFDRGGNVSSTTVTVQATKDQKIGLFTLMFEDVSVPATGVPLSLLRVYDSRDKSSGDFGFGWRLSVQSLRLRANREQGSGWQANRSGGFFPTYSIVGSDPHKITVTLPGGKAEEFDLTISPSSQLLLPITFATASYTARAGTNGTLRILSNDSLFIEGAQPGPVTLLDDGTFETFDPDLFEYTSSDGTAVTISKTEGVQRVRDPNGNTLTFGPNGIVHSGGLSILFTRDAQGRITRITDPNGNPRSYAYDQNGDLAAYTDPVGNVTRFFYNLSHGLIEIRDPRGARPARNEYDADGRLVATIDAAGNRMEYTHNIGASQEVIRDRRGNVTVLSYDANGLVEAKTDATGTILYTHDAHGNQLTMTDQLGHVWQHTYDAKDNVLTETDPLGHSIVRTYTDRGQVLTESDRNGGVTTYTYDARGNQLSVRDPLGRTAQYAYDGQGNRTSATDANGKVSTFAYDASGRRTSVTDALGRVTTYSYDANGNRLTDTVDTADGVGGRRTLITRRQYDAYNRLVADIDPAGGATRFEFNAIGKPSAIVDKNGNRTTFQYDERGNRVGATFADGTSESMAYDEEANMIRWTDRAGRTTTYTYDAANRQTSVTYADGATTHTEYDAVGHIVAQVDERGNRTRYEYDAAGRRTAMVDALNNRTTYVYDARGKMIASTDPLSHTTSYVYDANGRLTRTTYADGSSVLVAYDVLGRKQSETDQLGHTTTFSYDALGRLVDVTNAAGGHTTYAYDEVGNRVSQTDTRSHVTRWIYDGAGRVTRRTLPLGQAESFTYDGMGNLLTRTDFTGRVTTYTYDPNNQLATRRYPDGSQNAFTYTASVRRRTAQDPRGVTTYTYDLRDRLTRVTQPDGTALSYAFDLHGNTVSVTAPSGTTTTTYDALNRVSTVTDAQGGVTSYTYDAAGNRLRVLLPNGARTLYGYDTLNRLVSVEQQNPGGVAVDRYVYALDAAGHRVSVTELSGRSVAYAYDVLSRLVGETIVDPVRGNHAIAYTYDAVGNRLSKSDNGQTVSFVYDENDRLLSETGGVTYGYDDNGNEIRRTTAGGITRYSYDFENRLTRVDDTGVSTYTYDADGVRVGETVSGTASTFLVDINRLLPDVVEERGGAGALIARYTYGGMDLVSQRRGTTTSYYHFDGSGSTRLLSNATGAITDSYVYDAFGLTLGATGVTPNRYRYGAQQFDSETGFYYLRARYYRPSNGRFLTIDPADPDPMRPITAHPYLYAGADPVNNSDPTGSQFVAAMSISIDIALPAIELGAVALFLLKLTAVVAATIAAVCALSFAISTFTAGNGPIDPCNAKGQANVFYPGDDTRFTTLHIATAIAGGYPSLLHRISPRQVWPYRATPACAGNIAALTGLWCDEYPFATTQEGGPGSSTMLVPAAEQLLQGGYLSAFYGLCAITPNVQPDNIFVVAPLVGAPLTTWVCRH